MTVDLSLIKEEEEEEVVHNYLCETLFCYSDLLQHVLSIASVKLIVLDKEGSQYMYRNMLSI